LFSGCKKEGCTDPDSINFEESAKKDDGSCQYEGSVVFWYGEVTSLSMIGDGIESLTFYVDGEVVGSSVTSVYWSGAPDCSSNSSITITKDLGNSKNQTFTYSVKDQDGIEQWEGIVNFTANTCLSLQLTY
jgi:hypothetical protein